MATHFNRGAPQGLPLALLAQAIPQLTRQDLESLTERLICTAADDGCGAYLKGDGRLYWGDPITDAENEVSVQPAVWKMPDS